MKRGKSFSNACTLVKMLVIGFWHGTFSALLFVFHGERGHGGRGSVRSEINFSKVKRLPTGAFCVLSLNFSHTLGPSGVLRSESICIYNKII